MQVNRKEVRANRYKTVSVMGSIVTQEYRFSFAASAVGRRARAELVSKKLWGLGEEGGIGAREKLCTRHWEQYISGGTCQTE